MGVERRVGSDGNWVFYGVMLDGEGEGGVAVKKVLRGTDRTGTVPDTSWRSELFVSTVLPSTSFLMANL